MLSRARDSRGARENGKTGAVDGQAPRKHRYVAITSRVWVYDVLNARTSEKNGAPPTIEAAAGSVTVCAERAAAGSSSHNPLHARRMADPLNLSTSGRRDGHVRAPIDSERRLGTLSLGLPWRQLSAAGKEVYREYDVLLRSPMSRTTRGQVAPRREAGGKAVAAPDVSSEKRIRLAVAVQPTLFCEVLAGHLDHEQDLQVVGKPSTEDEIVRLLKAESLQVLVFDYEGMGPNSERTIFRLHRLAPATRILVLATRSSQETVVRVLRVGASGLVGKQLDAATVLRAIHTLANGELWANRRATADFVEQLADSAGRVPLADGQLTDREWEILAGVGQGLRNKDIARRLSISEKTVKSHLNNVFRKLRVDNRFAAGMYALKHDQPKA